MILATSRGESQDIDCVNKTSAYSDVYDKHFILNAKEFANYFDPRDTYPNNYFTYSYNYPQLVRDSVTDFSKIGGTEITQYMFE